MKVNYDGHEHEHEFEPEYGLPEPLPAGERVLWQGSPDWRLLARRVFHVHALTLYFIAILAIRAIVVLTQGGTIAEAARAMAMLAPLAALAVGVGVGMALLSARTTVYTITDKRVTMRIGIVLNLTFNLPFTRIATAGLRDTGQGTGDIPLALDAADRIAYLHLWPHARPWRIAHPEPMLRCIPDAAQVAQVLAQAWTTARGLAPRPVAAPSASLEALRPATAAASGRPIETAPRGRWFAGDRAPRLTQGA
jgi:hypothetical protein